MRDDTVDRWESYSAAGVLLGFVEFREGRSGALPWYPHVRILSASSDELWGLTLDDLDVPTIHRWKVQRTCGLKPMTRAMEDAMRDLRPVIVAFLAVAVVARPAMAQSPRTTDSAGVRVVLNPDPGSNPPSFRLSARPRVSIGKVEGAPEDQLFRANQAFVLSDGSIVVSNTGTQELRFYDRTGKVPAHGGKKG
jgi:hypothetical protein